MEARARVAKVGVVMVWVPMAGWAAHRVPRSVGVAMVAVATVRAVVATAAVATAAG